MNRALGLDYGDARIGLALSDSLRMLASPLETIDRRRIPDAPRRVADLVAEHEVDTVVVGLPLHLDGGAGKAAAKVRGFLKPLRALLPGQVAIVEVDERLSTSEATERLLGGKRRREFNRGQIDQAAAAVILQDYLDVHQQPSLVPDIFAADMDEDEDMDEDDGDWDDDEEDDDEEWDEDDDEKDLGALEEDEDEDDWEDDKEEDDGDWDDDEDDDEEWEEDEDEDEVDDRKDSRWGRVWEGFDDDD